MTFNELIIETIKDEEMNLEYFLYLRDGKFAIQGRDNDSNEAFMTKIYPTEAMARKEFKEII